MSTVLVPVRYPLSEHSKGTLEQAIEIATERGDQLIVLHVDLYHDSTGVTRRDLKAAVEDAFGPLAITRYRVSRGFLVEETILDEVAAEGADLVVIGHKQAGRWRRAFQRLVDNPDIADYLASRVGCEVLVVEKA